MPFGCHVLHKGIEKAAMQVRHFDGCIVVFLSEIAVFFVPLPE